jgi:hypothetical protein
MIHPKNGAHPLAWLNLRHQPLPRNPPKRLQRRKDSEAAPPTICCGGRGTTPKKKKRDSHPFLLPVQRPRRHHGAKRPSMHLRLHLRRNSRKRRLQGSEVVHPWIAKCGGKRNLETLLLLRWLIPDYVEEETTRISCESRK